MSKDFFLWEGEDKDTFSQIKFNGLIIDCPVEQSGVKITDVTKIRVDPDKFDLVELHL